MKPVGALEERKLVTVLFADLARSTALFAGRDAEQVRAMLGAFFEEMAREVRAFGGTVEKYAGDAIMAVFGVPRVHEDDAERAVRAAAAMQESLAQLNPVFEQEYGVRLELRVGVATGEVVAAAGPATEFLVTGEVSNLAARLQAVATGIVLSADTYRLVGPLVDVERLDGLALKGFDGPITAYRVKAVRAGEGRRHGIPGLSSPMVGRDRELRVLEAAIDALRQGRGQIASIVGEAGIGKSRLKLELRDHLAPGVQWLEGRCQAHTEMTSYAPFVQILRSVCRLGGAEPGAIARTKLRASLRELVGPRDAEVQPVIAQLLGIETGPGGNPGPPTDPRAVQSQLIVGMRALVEALATRQPAVLAFEDVHWADSASVELLTVLLELTDVVPLMLLITCRPDVEGRSWDLRFHAQRNYPHRLTEITIAPLDAAHASTLAGNLLHISDLPEQLGRQILARSEGNPFFLEEIVRTLIERGVLQRRGDRWAAVGDLDRMMIPDTLRGVLAARIDRLPAAAKGILQRAAVIGRFFGYGVLRALSDPAEELDRALAHLLRTELIRERIRLPEREYLFKHALTQEAAYASVVGEHRRLLHRRVAEHLEQSLADAAAAQSAILAHHWLHAQDAEKALHYSLLAAEQARRLYASAETVAHYWQVLELLKRLPSTPERQQIRASALLALLDTPGWRRSKADEIEGFAQINAGIEWARNSGNETVLARLQAHDGLLRHDESQLQQALARAEAVGDARVLGFVEDWYAGYLGREGRYETSLVHANRAIEFLGAIGERYEQALALAGSGRCYSARAGRLDESLRYAAAARAIAEELGDARLRAWRAMEAEPYMYRGAWADVVRVAEEALPGAWEIGEDDPVLFVSGWLGIAYAKLGRPDEARRVIGRALREGRARLGVNRQLAWVEMALANLHLAQGEGEAARAAAGAALQLVDKTQFSLEAGAAHRLLGQAWALSGEAAQAESAFRESLRILNGIESRPELAQTLLAYGRFRIHVDPAEGRRLIEQALRLFERMGADGWVAEAAAALRA
jgi:class 3 adenylate cyclase/tetratricopeptide (TPR) repeat protein